LQVRVGEVVLKKLSGNLWTLPLEAGTSGEAKVSSGNETNMTGTIMWKAQSAGTGRSQIVADVWYMYAQGLFGEALKATGGKWTANYSHAHTLPESTVSAINRNRVETKLNLLIAGAAQKQPTALPESEPPPPISAPQVAEKPARPVVAPTVPIDQQPSEVIGTLVTKDSLTGNAVSSVEVKIVDAGPDKTVYSSGDVIGRDGSVLQVRVGEVVLKKLSGNLWTLPLEAGTSGEAKVMSDNQTDMPGTIRWKSHSAAEGVQIVADVVYTVYLSTAVRINSSPSGNWTASYKGANALPESTETSIRGKSYTNMVSTKLNVLTAGAAQAAAVVPSGQRIKN
jgi:hypothetical protein